MATLFISDLHLSEERPGIISLFLSFLDEKASSAEALYILGDLFEVWIGDDAVPAGMERVLKGLAELTAKHVPVYIMAGNRDFLMGSRFEKLTGCKLIADPTIIDLYGKSTLLLHGDTLCTDDVDYQQFREMVRNPEWQEDFLSKTVDERIEIGKHARQESMARTSEKPEAIMDVNNKTVESVFRSHDVAQMIHGHTHRPAIHNLCIDNQNLRRIVLGDWYNQASILEVENDVYRLSPGI
ncbi:UDP-2,3-diacylglucosamine diphosphatase [Kaarinaea lacus]